MANDLISVVEIILDSDHYLIDSDLINRFVKPISGKKLYNAPPYILGIADYEGEVITLVDITLLLGFEDKADVSSKRTLIIPAGVISEYAMAITVDYVCGVRSIRKSDIMPVDFSVIEKLQGYVKGVVRTGAFMDHVKRTTGRSYESDSEEEMLLYLDIRSILTGLLAGCLRKPMSGFYYWGN